MVQDSRSVILFNDCTSERMHWWGTPTNAVPDKI